MFGFATPTCAAGVGSLCGMGTSSCPSPDATSQQSTRRRFDAGPSPGRNCCCSQAQAAASSLATHFAAQSSQRRPEGPFAGQRTPSTGCPQSAQPNAWGPDGHTDAAPPTASPASLPNSVTTTARATTAAAAPTVGTDASAGVVAGRKYSTRLKRRLATPCGMLRARVISHNHVSKRVHAWHSISSWFPRPPDHNTKGHANKRPLRQASAAPAAASIQRRLLQPSVNQRGSQRHSATLNTTKNPNLSKGTASTKLITT
mmetsp:Transcript_89727/g.258844  ORF Transcript_89727/g.258844 Transcript_89727/m.258844 type:complete len:258 (-) Transcript_89727:199-972(-)